LDLDYLIERKQGGRVSLLDLDHLSERHKGGKASLLDLDRLQKGSKQVKLFYWTCITYRKIERR